MSVSHNEGDALGAVAVDKRALAFFSSVIGESGAVFTDEAAAKKAGHSSLVAPPTYLFCLLTMSAEPVTGETLQALGVQLSNVLHGEQKFEYVRPVCAGERLLFKTQLSNRYDKKGGALSFLVFETVVTDGQRDVVCKMQQTLAVRGGVQ